MIEITAYRCFEIRPVGLDFLESKRSYLLFDESYIPSKQ